MERIGRYRYAPFTALYCAVYCTVASRRSFQERLRLFYDLHVTTSGKAKNDLTWTK